MSRQGKNTEGTQRREQTAQIKNRKKYRKPRENTKKEDIEG